MTNTTPGRAVDPRFDPAFQPGYDPQSDPTRAARIPTYDASVDSPRLQPGRVIEPPRALLVPHRSSTNTDTDAGEQTPSVEQPPPPAPLGRNPFLLALWVVGAGFVLSGALLIGNIKSLNDVFATSADAATDYIYLQIAMSCVPAAFILGFGTFVAVLFLHAHRWSSRI